MSYNKKLNKQYEVMTKENLNEDGKYVPNFEALIAEAPSEEMKKAWEEVVDLIEKTKDTDFPFSGFTFRTVYTHEKEDGTFTIYQYGFPAEWDKEICEKKLLEMIEDDDDGI